MSGAAAAPPPATGTLGTTNDTSANGKPLEPSKKPSQLEEDDEFEDFPVEDWPDSEDLSAQTPGHGATSTSTTAAAGGAGAGQPGGQQPTGPNTHLWEESWDDDDTNDDFAKQLKEEIAKVRK